MYNQLRIECGFTNLREHKLWQENINIAALSGLAKFQTHGGQSPCDVMNLFIEFGRYEPTEAPVNIESVHVNETPNL